MSSQAKLLTTTSTAEVVVPDVPVWPVCVEVFVELELWSNMFTPSNSSIRTIGSEGVPPSVIVTVSPD